MANPLRLFLVAGEPSGDRLGADLVKRLRLKREVHPSGVGGPALAGEGLHSLFSIEDLSVMGFGDVLRRLPLLLWRVEQIVRAILAEQPDVTVLIDSQVLSETVARRLRKRGYAGRIVLYVAPSVWAWKPERAAALTPLMDEVLAILPFEPEVMAQLDGPPTAYVGHPTVEETSMREAVPLRGPLLLLPGSRAGEVRRHLPLMEAVAVMLHKHHRVTELILPTVKPLEARVREAVAKWSVPVTVVTGTASYSGAIAAVAKMGTVTLELAMRGVPMIATYVAEPAQLRRAEKYGATQAALPNILAEHEIVPEVIMAKADAALLVDFVRRLLDDPSIAEAQLDAFRAIRWRMEQGDPGYPLVDAAERVLALADQRLVSAT